MNSTYIEKNNLLYYSSGMKERTSHKTIKSITITASMGALIIVMGLTHIGFIPWFSGASITIMQIPVILAALIAGKYSGLGTGFIFGVLLFSIKFQNFLKSQTTQLVDYSHPL